MSHYEQNSRIGIQKAKSLLDELRTKSDQFASRLFSGFDQVGQHCAQLRKEVDLQTQILTDQINQIHSKLISEIDTYEMECVMVYMETIDQKRSEFGDFLNELAKFHSETDAYFKNTKIDQEKLQDLCVFANDYLSELKRSDASLKSLKFNGQLMQFQKSSFQIEDHSLGSLFFRQLNFDKLKQINFNVQIMDSEAADLRLFKHKNTLNHVFYSRGSHEFRVSTFDDNGDPLGRLVLINSPEIRILNVKVTKLADKFLLSAFFDIKQSLEYYCYFQEELIHLENCNIVFLVDQNFGLIKHVAFENEISHLAANESKILMIDSLKSYFFYDSSSGFVEDRSIDKIKPLINGKILSLEMNESHVFVLLEKGKLKVFDLSTFGLFGELDVDANQMKLVSDRYLSIFNSATRLVYLYDQSSMNKEEEINLDRTINTGLQISSDKSRFISFVDKNRIRWFSA
jgi:hypothetical protein